jgi:hypothetical protein
MSTSQEMYRYDQLPQGEVFRYLDLEPGVGNDPLKCHLHTAKIADTQFEAVSYTWGKGIRNQTIICKGHVMMITENLDMVLRRVRLPDRSLALWADSICIDQENREEKEHQVALMGKIYSAADCVLLYMGKDEDNHGPAVCSLLQEMNQMIQTKMIPS